MMQKPDRPSQAVIDLGLVPPAPDDRTMSAFRTRAISLLLDVQLAHGHTEAAALFEGLAALARAFANERKSAPVNRKRKPPQKRKGATHDPGGDVNLLALWRHTPYATKQEFARQIIKRKLVRVVEPASLVRRLNRLLTRA